MSASSVTPSGSATRARIVSNIALSAVLVVSALHLISGLMSLGEPTGPSSTTGTSLAMATNAVLLISYLVLVLRAPTAPRWIYLALLALLMLFAFGSALSSNGEGQVREASTTSVVVLLAVVGFLALPAIYMRLVTPKSASAKR